MIPEPTKDDKLKKLSENEVTFGLPRVGTHRPKIATFWVFFYSQRGNLNNFKAVLTQLFCHVFTFFLKNTFSRDLDEMWVEHDKDKNGYLDKSEARTFVAEVKKVISEERGEYYDEASFD